MRSGIITKKLGMTHLYNEQGAHISVTVLALEGCIVTAMRTEERDGYNAVQCGNGMLKPKHSNKAMLGSFAKAGVEPRKNLREFRVSKENLLECGHVFTADFFTVGQFVDVQATSIGKGFQGVIKRHHFGGGRATHGNSVSHRAHGSTGNRQDPGRVFKGKKMAGHMGARTVTTQNLKIVRVDVERGLIFVEGSVPGARQSLVAIKDAVKKSA